MTPPRIVPLEEPFPSEVGPLLATMTPAGAANPLALFRVLAKNAALFERMMATGGHFLGQHSTLSVRDREIVIDRTCARCGNEYEWGVHVTRYAQAAGLDEAAIRHTVAYPPDPDAWMPNEVALIEMVDGLHAKSTLDDEAWSALAAHYDEAQIIELVALCGWYRTLSYLCNALRVPLESWQARLPKAL